MNEYPDCWVQDEDGVWICYVMEHDDHEHLDFDERILHKGYDAEIVEVTKRCRICGEMDIYYPL
jgi:hypothetical protein